MLSMWLILVLCACTSVLARAPNFVVILTDDQDLELGGLTPMKNAQKLLAEQGATAKNWFVHTPVCCPSRAQMLTGRMFHNLRNRGPGGGCMHINETLVNPDTFALKFARASYRVGIFGKYLNDWDVHQRTWPPGFERFFANGGGNDEEPGGYTNPTYQDQDRVYQGHPGEYAGYGTAIIGNKSVDWLRTVAPGPQPFVLLITPKAPHIAATPAPWYQHVFSDRFAPRTPSYNFSALDHHWLVAQQGPITHNESLQIDELFRNRWRSLLSVDDIISEVVATLQAAGVLNDTYIFLTSDHGYQLGQLRLPMCKLNVYDHNTRVPFLVRGPGIRANSTFDAYGSNVDLAPTMLALAGLPWDDLDGRNMLPALLAAPAQTSTVSQTDTCHYIEYFSLGDVVRMDHLVDTQNNTYRALRCQTQTQGTFLYAQFYNLIDWQFQHVVFREFFDLVKDPFQMKNIVHQVSPTLLDTLDAQLASLFQCKGEACRTLVNLHL
eukprot:m.235967 g.235967  ORF g.235967 m.235967 type:complete len:493 (+) comp20371_c0_seq1:17-1495(+)